MTMEIYNYSLKTIILNECKIKKDGILHMQPFATSYKTNCYESDLIEKVSPYFLLYSSFILLAKIY